MNNGCIDISIYGEKNYKLFLEAIKQELDRSKYTDLTAIQALILLNINDNAVTIGEVLSRGYYLGSNASYNIKKLTKTGYIAAVPSDYDKRAIIIQLTKKGIELCSKIDTALSNHLELAIKKTKIKLDMDAGLEFLKNVERFWNEVLHRRI